MSEVKRQLEALSNFLDDPASGTGAADDFKRRLSDIILNLESSSTENAERILGEAVDVLMNSDAQAELFQKYYRRAKNIENYIAAPSVGVPGRNTAFDKFEQGVFKI